MTDAERKTIYNKRYRTKHRDRILATEKQWRDKHRDELRGYNAKWREGRRATIRQQSKKWRLAHLELASARSKACYYAKREEYAAKKRVYNDQRRDEINAKNRAYRVANIQKVLARTEAYREANRERLREKNREYQRANPEKGRERTMRRIAAIQKAIPPWADLDAIKTIYREAARLTRETGISYHVDHVVPLRGRNVCGLHVAHNLQVITEAENLRKSNRLLIPPQASAHQTGRAQSLHQEPVTAIP